MCSIGSYPNPGVTGALTCIACSPGTFAAYPGAICAPCPNLEGVVCTSGAIATISGYWAYLQNFDSFQTVLCSTEDDCPGSGLIDPTAWNNLVYQQVLAPQCAYPNQDSDTVPMCADCVDGYIRWQSRCIPCDAKVNGGLLFGMIVVTFCIVILLFLTSGSSSSSAWQGMLIFYVQISAIQVRQSSSNLYHLHEANTSGASWFNECWLNATQYHQVLIALAMPFWLCAQLGLLFLFHRDVLLRFWPARFTNSFSTANYRSTISAILLFCYTEITITCITYFNCTYIGQFHVVYQWPHIQCDSDTYKGYMVPVALMFILYVLGIPLSVTTYLFTHRKSIRDAHAKVHATVRAESDAGPLPIVPSPASSTAPHDVELKFRQSVTNGHEVACESTVERSSVTAGAAGPNSSALSVFTSAMSPPPTVQSADPFVSSFGILFLSYKPDTWYWTIVILAERFIFVLFSIFLWQQHTTRNILFCLLHIACAHLHLLKWPYISVWGNRTQSALHQLLLIQAILLASFGTIVDLWLEVVLFLLILIPSLALVVVIVYSKGVQWKSKIDRWYNANEQQDKPNIDTSQHEHVTM